MKRTLPIAAVALMAGLGLAGCSQGTSDSACVGEWTLSGMEQSGEAASQEELDQLKELGWEMGMVVEADGAAALTFGEESQSGTWEADDGGCVFTLGGDAVQAKVEDGKLTMEEGSQKIIFEKK